MIIIDGLEMPKTNLMLLVEPDGKVWEMGDLLGDDKLLDGVKAIPAADVRPVVFCRDCKHRDPEDHKCDCGQLERAGCVFPVDDDYYCAYGVKREESRAEMRNRRIGND